MNDAGSQPKLVKAVYNFQPTNTDELCFHKGDVITVTQMVDGGWWEGTLRGVTGWFPSNYVREVKASSDGRADAKSPRCKSPETKVVKRDSSNASVVVSNPPVTNSNHLVVLQEIIGNEKKFVTLVEELIGTYLRPLENNSFLQQAEYTDLCSNLDEILSLHQSLLAMLEGAFKLPVSQQRFGKIFLDVASKLQPCYHRYSSNHPKAAAVLQAKRDEFNKYMEELGVSSSGLLLLTTRLSKPFQQIERYSNLLKELERHSDETNADRGDIQRAIIIYREISQSCSELRRQKEMEFDILHSDIRGWEGEEISQLGEVVMLSHVWIQLDNSERKERYLVLFPGCLVLMSITARISGYVFEGRMELSNASVNNVEDTEKNAFEITGGSGIDRLTVLCASPQEKSKWLTHLKPHVKHMAAFVTAKPQNLQVLATNAANSKPPVTSVGNLNSIAVKPSMPSSSQVVNSTTFCKSVGAVVLNHKWNLSCLRPCPPLRPATFVKDDGTRSPRAGRRILGSGRRKLVDDAKVLEEDAVILRVIESYCTSAKVRQTVSSSLLENPQVLIAEEEKIIVEEVKGDQMVVEEKTLVDTVYSLKDQLRELRQEQQRMRRDLDNERRARKRLESLLRNSLKNIVENTVEVHDSATIVNAGVSGGNT